MSAYIYVERHVTKRNEIDRMRRYFQLESRANAFRQERCLAMMQNGYFVDPAAENCLRLISSRSITSVDLIVEEETELQLRGYYPYELLPDGNYIIGADHYEVRTSRKYRRVYCNGVYVDRLLDYGLPLNIEIISLATNCVPFGVRWSMIFGRCWLCNERLTNCECPVHGHVKRAWSPQELPRRRVIPLISDALTTPLPPPAKLPSLSSLSPISMEIISHD